MKLIFKTFYNNTVWKWIIGVSLLPPVFFYSIAFINGNITSLTADELRQMLLSWGVSFLISFSLFVYNGYVYTSSFRKWPSPEQQSRHLWKAIVISLLGSNGISMVIMYFLTHWTKGPYSILANILLVSVITIVVGLWFLGRNYIRLWKQIIIDREQLEKENIKNQLLGLQHQLSPHFLFNSFNALQSLVDADAQKAKTFIQELSRVYRYTLESGKENLVTLEDELNFIRRYIFLQKVRFGDNLQVAVDVDALYLKDMLPPLSLQLLVENAIKHNEVSSSCPLSISIRAEKGKLLVTNNLQLRSKSNESTGIGLENLQLRYKLLDKELPRFHILQEQYIAELPLIHIA